MAEKQSVPERLRAAARDRAAGCCEYCLLHDDMVVLPHQVDHVIAEQHGGMTNLENLAWSCFYCNHYKGPQHFIYRSIHW